MPKTITIIGDAIPLPKRLAKQLQGKRAIVDVSGVRVLDDSRNEFSQARAVLKEVGKQVTQKDLDAAIRWARTKLA